MTATGEAARDVAVRGEVIRLGQFLKLADLADLADSGSDAAALVAAGSVTVNGRPEARRGRQLTAGDVVGAPAGRARVVLA